MGLFDFLKPGPDPQTRLGGGNLTVRGGSVFDRQKYGPPHICDRQRPSILETLTHGGDYGAVWRCDCGQQWVLKYSDSAAPSSLPYAWEKFSVESVSVETTGRPGLVNPPPQ